MQFGDQQRLILIIISKKNFFSMLMLILLDSKDYEERSLILCLNFFLILSNDSSFLKNIFFLMDSKFKTEFCPKLSERIRENCFQAIFSLTVANTNNPESLDLVTLCCSHEITKEGVVSFDD